MELGIERQVPPLRIARLPEILVNQIAAGEVVERPASAIKELVENSLDAGSRRIEVSLLQGGVTEIQVLDDGSGMAPGDLLLAVERHTTSKLRSADDLEAIRTFGFRGEALSSIASVSEMEIRSRTADAPGAFSLTVHYGERQGELRPVGAPVGTAITIRRLFERLPARQKFLRSPGTELAHCARIVKELALGNPGTHFHLRHHDKAIAEYVAGSREARFRECCRVGWEPLVLAEEGEGVRLEAYLSPPDRTFERADLYLYMNGRAVRNRSLCAAVRNAYLEAWGPGHEPTGVIHLDLRFDWVDVNVHPQKLEVRCLRQDMLYAWLLAATRKAVGRRVTPPPEVAPEPAVTLEAPRGERGLRYLGELRGQYLLAEDDEGLLVVDARALCQHLRFVELLAAVGAGTAAPRKLAVPHLLRLPPELLERLDGCLGRLAAVGLELEPFGDGDVAVKSFPAWLDEAELGPAVTAAVQALGAGDGEDAAGALARALACRAALSDGRLDAAHAERLLAGLPRAPLDGPSGTPLSFRLSFATLAKHFERSS